MENSSFELRTVYLYFKYCNLKCRHCWINPPYSDTASVKKDEASLEEIISALEECRRLGMDSVKLTGGEPFTRSDILELLDYLGKNKIKVHVETNAALIRKREARALKEAGAWHVGVSLDGPTAQIHENLRGVSGSFDDALEGIKALIVEGINTQIVISLWKGNREYIKSTIALARTLGISSVKINPIHGMLRADTMAANDETLTVRETIEFHGRLMEEMKSEPAINVIFDIPPAFRPIDDVRTGRICTCGIFGILGILGDGGISICGIGSNVDTLVLGHIGQDSIKDIWTNHAVLKEMRDNIPGNMKGICGRCMLKHYCLGKCRAEAYYTGGSMLAPLTFCQSAYEEGLFPKSRMIN